MILQQDHLIQKRADDSRDYDYTKTTATAASEQPSTGTEGPASFAVDNNTGTWWHTNWNVTVPMSDFWITLELEDETMLDALRYYGRDGSINGHVGDYKVEVSTDGGGRQRAREPGRMKRAGRSQCLSSRWRRNMSALQVSAPSAILETTGS